MSITEIARAANVSVATVSRQINGTANVSPEKSARIEASMKELAYTPRAVRPGPKPFSRRGIRTGNILLLAISDFDPSMMYHMPVFPLLLGAMQERLREHQLHLILGHSPTGREIPPALLSRSVDGALILGGDIMPSCELRRRLRRIPSVWTLRTKADPSHDFDHVFFQNAHIGAMAARYLAKRGCEHIAFLNPIKGHGAFQTRLESFMAEANMLGLKTSVEECSSSLTASRSLDLERTTLRLMAIHPRPSGLFVAADDALLVAFNALRVAGIRPERDVHLIGCNNEHRFMEGMHPRPATIDIQISAVGRQAVDRLLWRMRNPEETDHVEILIEPALVPSSEDTHEPLPLRTNIDGHRFCDPA